MKLLRPMLIVACVACAGAALAQTSPTYLKRADARFGDFAGSSDNLESLVAGMRTGSAITLTGSGAKVTFTAPTKPLGYGEITRALDLAQRELAAAGIKDPTPAELQAALTGGTITGPNGPVTLDGVLKLRSQGMGWGQIAHTIGVHPGMGKSETTAVPASGAASSGISTAGGRSGIVTAAGGSPITHGNGRALGLQSDGATSAAGVSSAGGPGGTKGQGNAFGRAGK